MKRHNALAPLSREHHGALILAQLLNKDVPDYKGLPTEPVEKAAYAVNCFYSTLQPHFKKEEEILLQVKHCNQEINRVVEEIFIEHVQLTESFLALTAEQDLVTAMHKLGEHLNNHIRKEERILFPLIQEHCSQSLLDELEAQHH